MAEKRIDKTLTDFGQRLTLIESRAGEISTRFEVLQKEAESLKMESLQRYLGKQRKDIARSRGLTMLLKDKRKAQSGLLVAVGSLIVGGLISKDKFVALNAGMSSFDGVLRRMGETKWFVSLGKGILVAPEDSLPSKRTWFTWERLMPALEKLKKRALHGEQLGALDDIIDNLESIASSTHTI
ncbi:hypothetical protein ACFLST_00770 [Chloroflexota bacterium]